MSGEITKVYEADTRRRWSAEDKLAIVEESKTAPVARVAKKHGVAVGLLFRWRQKHGIRGGARVCPPSHGFVRLALPPPAADTGDKPCGDGAIEIVLTGGRRVVVGKAVDTAALLRIVEALDRR
jgi:transposase